MKSAVPKTKISKTAAPAVEPKMKISKIDSPGAKMLKIDPATVKSCSMRKEASKRKSYDDTEDLPGYEVIERIPHNPKSIFGGGGDDSASVRPDDDVRKRTKAKKKSPPDGKREKGRKSDESGSMRRKMIVGIMVFAAFVVGFLSGMGKF